MQLSHLSSKSAESCYYLISSSLLTLNSTMNPLFQAQMGTPLTKKDLERLDNSWHGFSFADLKAIIAVVAFLFLLSFFAEKVETSFTLKELRAEVSHYQVELNHAENWHSKLKNMHVTDGDIAFMKMIGIGYGQVYSKDDIERAKENLKQAEEKLNKFLEEKENKQSRFYKFLSYIGFNTNLNL